MAELIRDIDPERVRRKLEGIRERVGDGVEVLAATKYVEVERMSALLDAGVSLVGENRLQDLQAKRERWGDAFQWDFIGALQSRKVATIAPMVRLIHSLCTDSALAQLARLDGPGPEVLVQVNVAGEEGKSGIAPSELAASSSVARCR